MRRGRSFVYVTGESWFVAEFVKLAMKSCADRGEFEVAQIGATG